MIRPLHTYGELVERGEHESSVNGRIVWPRELSCDGPCGGDRIIIGGTLLATTPACERYAQCQERRECCRAYRTWTSAAQTWEPWEPDQVGVDIRTMEASERRAEFSVTRAAAAPVRPPKHYVRDAADRALLMRMQRARWL